MSSDENINDLEREIDSLETDVEKLQAALAARKAKLAAEQARFGTEPPGAITATRQAEEQAYPVLQEIQLTPQHATDAESGSGPTSSDERRRSGRTACAFAVEFNEETHFFAGLTQDISEGGLFVATYQRLPVGTHVELSFELPGGARVSAQGEVRWVRASADHEHRPGLGICFTELSEDSAQRISEFCAGRPPLYIEM